MDILLDMIDEIVTYDTIKIGNVEKTSKEYFDEVVYSQIKSFFKDNLRSRNFDFFSETLSESLPIELPQNTSEKFVNDICKLIKDNFENMSTEIEKDYQYTTDPLSKKRKKSSIFNYIIFVDCDYFSNKDLINASVCEIDEDVLLSIHDKINSNSDKNNFDIVIPQFLTVDTPMRIYYKRCLKSEFPKLIIYYNIFFDKATVTNGKEVKNKNMK